MSKDGSTESEVRSFEAFQSSKDGATYYSIVLFVKFLKCQFF
jgi:hypothetical protein